MLWYTCVLHLHASEMWWMNAAKLRTTVQTNECSIDHSTQLCWAWKLHLKISLVAPSIEWRFKSDDVQPFCSTIKFTIPMNNLRFYLMVIRIAREINWEIFAAINLKSKNVIASANREIAINSTFQVQLSGNVAGEAFCICQTEQKRKQKHQRFPPFFVNCSVSTDKDMQWRALSVISKRLPYSYRFLLWWSNFGCFQFQLTIPPTIRPASQNNNEPQDKTITKFFEEFTKYRWNFGAFVCGTNTKNERMTNSASIESSTSVDVECDMIKWQKTEEFHVI